MQPNAQLLSRPIFAQLCLPWSVIGYCFIALLFLAFGLFYCIVYSVFAVIPYAGWPQFGKKKIQGLLKDLKLTFPDLLRRRFCQVTGFSYDNFREYAMFWHQKKTIRQHKKKISNLTQQVMLANPL